VLCSVAIAIADGVCSATQPDSTRTRSESIAIPEFIAVAESAAKSNASAQRGPESDACANR
jgi:hypothetical protein